MGFPAIQAAYAAHGVACYPLQEKVPAVKGYANVGAAGSAQLAMKFKTAEAAGFVAGRRNRLTIVDIDSTDHRLVDETERILGRSPLHVQTPSGGWHAYFRHDEEPRHIRVLPNVDLLGAGNVVAAGSKTPRGRYEIVRGTLDDLDQLPRMVGSAAPPQAAERVPVGKRNSELFKYLRGIVGHCDDLNALLDAAHTWAADRLAAPLAEAEIAKTAGNVWRFRGGRRPFMQHVIEGPKFAELTADLEVWGVCSYLLAENGPAAEFMIADGLADARGWPRRVVPRARRMLVESGIIECVRPPRKGAPGLYRWSLPRDE